MATPSEAVPPLPVPINSGGRWTPETAPRAGRPKGCLNKTTIEVKELAQSLIENPEYRRNLMERITAGEAPQMEVLMWFYAYGKPKERVEHSGDFNLAEVIKRARERAKGIK